MVLVHSCQFYLDTEERTHPLPTAQSFGLNFFNFQFTIRHLNIK